jgi:hypothetical protein
MTESLRGFYATKTDLCNTAVNSALYVIYKIPSGMDKAHDNCFNR